MLWGISKKYNEYGITFRKIAIDPSTEITTAFEVVVLSVGEIKKQIDKSLQAFLNKYPVHLVSHIVGGPDYNYQNNL